MNLISSWLRRSHSIRLATLLLAAASAVFAVTAPAVRADEIRVCPNYGVVRDRNDHEAPLLPRRSVAHCARNYQTLYQTYRVFPESRAPQRREADVLRRSASQVDPATVPAAETPESAPASAGQ